MKVLLPVDGSEYTKRMLGYVAAHDELFGRDDELVFVTVVTPLSARVSDHLGQAVVADYHRSQADEVLQPIRAFAKQHGWKSRDLYLVGHVATTIASLAEAEKPDMIVMGSRGHGAFAGLVLGSVASGVLAGCRTPVLLIR